jgi:hypothetical protein
MMIMSGIFQAIAGLVAIFENEFYVATRNYLVQFDATTWGWIHLFWSLLIIAVDVFVVWAIAAHGREVGV